MTDPRELIERLRDGNNVASWWVLASEAATALEQAAEEIARLRELFEAIVDRLPERDVKWAGMTARDIAIAALARPLSGE